MQTNASLLAPCLCSASPAAPAAALLPLQLYDEAVHREPSCQHGRIDVLVVFLALCLAALAAWPRSWRSLLWMRMSAVLTCKPEKPDAARPFTPPTCSASGPSPPSAPSSSSSSAVPFRPLAFDFPAPRPSLTSFTCALQRAAGAVELRLLRK